jgi:hypothetical protein
LEAIGLEMQATIHDSDQIRNLGQEYTQLEEMLEQAFEQWELMSKGELPA